MVSGLQFTRDQIDMLRVQCNAFRGFLSPIRTALFCLSILRTGRGRGQEKASGKPVRRLLLLCISFQSLDIRPTQTCSEFVPDLVLFLECMVR